MAHDCLIITHSGLRHVDQAEVRSAAACAEDARIIPVEIDTQPFKDDIQRGDWAGPEAVLLESARSILEAADRHPDATLHYFGVPEVPEVIALGAYIGDERKVDVHDFDRDGGSWLWPDDAPTVEVKTVGLPSGCKITARGRLVLRVVLSYPVSDEDVRAAVGGEYLADVTICFADENPKVGRIRSAADRDRVRAEVRSALATLRQAFPNIEGIDLFVSAPVSVCFAVGQELKPRNSPPIQTYRYRAAAGEIPHRPAIVLRDPATVRVVTPLTDDEQRAAAHVRDHVWAEALNHVVQYAANKKIEDGVHGPWYEALQPRGLLQAVAPFPTLKKLAALVPEEDAIDPGPFASEYGFDKDYRTWRLADPLLSGLHRAVKGDEKRLRQLIRLFLFHEYLHDFHSLTKYTAAEVGKFANCLEHIDYTADTYALLHQLDWTRIHDRRLVDTDQKQKAFLADQIELAILSFWAFDVGTVNEWQVRRIRRYLNWYWRHIQIKRAPDLGTALRVFGRQPRIEIAGLHQYTDGRRVMARLDRRDPTTHLEMGIVLEDERLFRLTEGPAASLVQLLAAFREGEHEKILQFFRSTFELASQWGSALPPHMP